MKFETMTKFMFGWFIFVGLLALGLLGFGIWVIMKLLAHFAVI